MVAEPISHSLLQNISFRTDCLIGPEVKGFEDVVAVNCRLLNNVVGCNIMWYGRQRLTFRKVMLSTFQDRG